ncbi:MAG: hypothetical protein GYB65_22260 [Chloroflexi bacterium]|nr:hypothetical protein [Chloroflexota bacterium]
MDKPTRTRKPIWTLLLLAPMSGEMLSGSMPPLEFFNPFAVVMLMIFYGSGALIIREFVRRWGKGLPSIWLLGLAYGIYEEGVVVRSFFDPAWGALDFLAEYGRWIGVNWIWTFGLTLFHATVSITIPIVLVELMYPAHRDQLWLTRRGLQIHCGLFLLWIPLSPLFEMHAPPLAFVGCAVAIVGLVILARRWTGPAVDAPHPPASPRRIMLLGFGGMSIIPLVLWFFPAWGFPPLVTGLLAFLLPYVVVGRMHRLGVSGWTDYHFWAFAFGGLVVWILIAFIGELSGALGMSLVGIGYAVFMRRLGRRIRQREPHDDAPTPQEAVEQALLPGGLS